jgi:hypothetical protein
MTRAKWSMMIGAVVVASGVFAGMAFAADGGHKAAPAVVQGVKDQQIETTLPKGDVFALKLNKAALASPEQLRAELDAAVAAGSITGADADIMFHKLTTGNSVTK